MLFPGTVSFDTNEASLNGIFFELRQIYPNFIADGKVTISTNSTFDEVNPPSNLFDGLNSYYRSNSPSDKYISIDFHENKFILTKYVMQRRLNSPNNPSSWTFYVYQGGKEVPICSNNSFPSTSSYEMRLFQCPSYTAFSKFLLHISRIGTDGVDTVAFSELEFFGTINYEPQEASIHIDSCHPYDIHNYIVLHILSFLFLFLLS